jgi:hypothetical protein
MTTVFSLENEDGHTLALFYTQEIALKSLELIYEGVSDVVLVDETNWYYGEVPQYSAGGSVYFIRRMEIESVPHMLWSEKESLESQQELGD